MARPRKTESKPVPRPASTPEARENQMIALAMDAAEEQLRTGKASSQVITHFLKLATAKESLERAKLENENKLLQAKTESLESQKHIEELYGEAIAAMRSYAGMEDESDR